MSRRRQWVGGVLPPIKFPEPKSRPTCEKCGKRGYFWRFCADCYPMLRKCQYPDCSNAVPRFRTSGTAQLCNTHYRPVSDQVAMKYVEWILRREEAWGVQANGWSK